jgi:magnesium-transporting ATPase (P-type)
MFDWHAEEADQVADHLNVDPSQGLDEANAAARVRTHGPNRPSVRRGQGPFARFLAQFGQPLVLVLIVAGTTTVFLGEWVDAGVIFGVVLVNAVVGFIQESKAEAALAALARVIASEATVKRAGIRRRLDAAELVPGDIVLLAAGDKVPADLRLFAGKELRVARRR